MAVDAFLKFEGLAGEGQKLGEDVDRLGDGFTDLGGAFIKLVDDVSSTDTNFLKADFAAHIKHDVFTVGEDFFKIGQEFIKLTGPLNTFDNAVVKFTDQFIKLTSDEPPFSLATDFVKLETDIKLTGLDFLATGSGIKSDAPTESLSLNFSKISFDYKEQSSDALNLSADLSKFLEISGISESSKVGEAFLKISLESVLISSAYSQLSTDFQKISEDFVPTEGSGPLKFDRVVLDHASDFIKLSQDLKLTDAVLSTLGGEFHKLADVLENPGPVTIPTITKG
jgi:hypothetical protein